MGEIQESVKMLNGLCKVIGNSKNSLAAHSAAIEISKANMTHVGLEVTINIKDSAKGASK